MGLYIKGLEHYLPPKVIDNKYLEEACGIDPVFLENKIGIKERRVASDDEPTSVMAVKAGTVLLAKQLVTPEEIDLLILCTQTPDYRLPGIAGLVHKGLGLRASCMAFDLSMGCSGYVYSLALADALMKTNGLRRAILIMAEQYSKTIDYRDRATASIFSDAASASLLAPCPEGFGYLAGVFGTDGTKADKLILPNSGVVKDPTSGSSLFMDGREIFKFAVHTVPESIRSLLSGADKRIEQVRFVVLHQANRYMLLELQKRIGLTDSQMVIDMEYIGNTVSSSIPIALQNLLERRAVAHGELLVLCGFGVGLSWGSVLYRHFVPDGGD